MRHLKTKFTDERNDYDDYSILGSIHFNITCPTISDTAGGDATGSGGSVSYTVGQIENDESDYLSYALFDMQGRQVSINKTAQSETQIQMKNLALAVYLLNVSDKNKTLKTFKITKKN
jgi:hypothetical protein